MKEKILSPGLIIHLIGLFFLMAAFAVNPLKITRAFFSDESVYYTMAYSFAFDGDMEFQQKDLIRVYREFGAGPQGIVLKLNERDNTIVFGKAYLYSLVASPFVRFLGTTGFFVLHALLLWLNLFCGYKFCSSFMQARKAILLPLLYFVANASLVYLFWMTPEYFNMSLICYGFYFFLTAEKKGNIHYYISALFFALATYSKITNAALVVPLGMWMLWWRKKTLSALITLALFVFSTVALFGLNIFFTGEWNYQGGRRSVFYERFPYDRAGASPFASFKQRKQVDVTPASYWKMVSFYWEAFSYNWLWFFFGRFSGLAIYFFPMFLGILYYLFSPKNSLSTAAYVAGWFGIFTYVIGIPWNYFGGSGTIGNRYLMNVFPVFLFVFTQEPSRRLLGTGFLCSLLFTSSFLFTPVFSSFDNSFHPKRSLYRLLPLEKTLLADLPVNTNPRARRVAFDQPPTYFLYFMDDNTYFLEAFDHRYGFWVKGERTAEIILRTFQPAKRLKVNLKSLSKNNSVRIEVNGKSTEIVTQENVFYEGELPLMDPFPYDRDNRGATFLYKIRIHSQKGVVQNGRYLGAFIRLDLPEAGILELPEEEPSEPAS